MADVTVKVSSFTTIPGGRLRGSGDNSAQEFFEEFLLPLIDDSSVGIITIDFSNTWGYPVSFTSQLGLYLVDTLGSVAAVKRKFKAVATDDPEVVSRFWQQMEQDS